MNDLHQLRLNIRDTHLADEQAVLETLIQANPVSLQEREQIVLRATQLVEDIRASDDPGLMESFLAEYGLSTDEGVALMCLAEALLRVPDAETMDALIEDKIAPSSWGEHLGQSSSSLVNASTWALMLTGKILNDDESEGFAGVLRGAVKRLGEPVIRTAVKQAMKELGSEFVLGRDIGEAIERGKKAKAKGFTYSYDMLGEAALTGADAEKFFEAYKKAINELAVNCTADDIRDNPGISIKLSALHPRYEVSQRERVMVELVESTTALAILAKNAGMGLNIDAEEADRLDLSLDVIEAVLRCPDLAEWDGFGIVVQAYSKRCASVIDWLHALASELDRKIMVRLVKGAYWDSEIKLAQQEGTVDFPVYTQKASTDAAYILCANKLLGMTDRIYPQFATHNAHTVAAILEIATDKQSFEFQRLHGMGDQLHLKVLEQAGTRCRIYAPVGAHRDLLAYLVRRLLENGANSSFVNQIVDTDIPAPEVASDPFLKIADSEIANTSRNAIPKPADLYAPSRINSKGWDLHSTEDLAEIEAARAPFKNSEWHVGALVAGMNETEDNASNPAKKILNPANLDDVIGSVTEATLETVKHALNAAQSWSDTPVKQRADILNKAADLYESNFGELFASLSREAGKGQIDVISELREAVDFLRYYAAEAERLEELNPQARGLIACISPWNFPLAIFTGQLSAALAAGNGVIAKPAEQTPITANIAIRLLHQAGVPNTALQLLPGTGSIVGSKLSSDPRINGICFTGSTATAQIINKSMAEHLDPRASLTAETGGLNAMIVDSTALPEQAVGDIVNSAFQSAGQRCSALRMLYLQEDTADIMLKMLYGAMDELVIGQPWNFDTDIGPVIDQAAKENIEAHIELAKNSGRILKSMPIPKAGNFIAPTVIKVDGIADLQEEIFGPVLHVATFSAEELDTIVDDINAKGYGLTFGLHTRIDDRVESITTRLKVGNMYINRNQIGAVVGSQPFGGEGLSGTGPKAGGPEYLKRFMTLKNPQQSSSAATEAVSSTEESQAPTISLGTLQTAINELPAANVKPISALDLPGPTGESNHLSTYARGVILCLGPTAEAALEQATVASEFGCSVLMITNTTDSSSTDTAALNGQINLPDLEHLDGIDAVALWGSDQEMRIARQALAARTGAILPLIYDKTDLIQRSVLERHICIDTTAAGGNATLLAASS